MNTSATAEYSQKHFDVLQFWHRLEFFIPFDLTKRTEISDHKKVLSIHRDNIASNLEEVHAYNPLPKKRISSMNLFIGVFPIAEVERLANELAPTDESESSLENSERGLPEGRSCFARFGLIDGLKVNFDDVEVSTLPWAIGQSRGSGVDALSSYAFGRSLMRLKGDLRNLDTRTSSEDGALLTAESLLGILATLEAWADFEVPGGEYPIACVEYNLSKPKAAGGKTTDVSATEMPKAVSPEEPIRASDEDDNGKGKGKVDGDNNGDGYTSESEIGILNSFFITDLEDAMECLRKGDDLGALRPYLTGVPEETRIDLYGDARNKALLDGLMPSLCNHGRWLSESAHKMSLMQQFAINKSVAMRSGTGLYSVNGPPGTGKTTLLREIIADNIVARAEVLSKLTDPKDAFEATSITTVYNQGKSSTVRSLKPELCGFGMIVASSNNAAVENISRDLPKAASITEPDDFGYIKSVAHKVAAQEFDGSFKVLSKDERPWGLIAAALGRSSNCYTFNQRIFFPAEKDVPVDKETGFKPQTIWEWRSSYSGPSFDQAARDFREQSAKVASAIEDANICAGLDIFFSDNTREGFVVAERSAVNEKVQCVARAQQELQDAADMAARLRHEADNLKEEERLLDRRRPAWWVRALGLPASREHRQRIAENAAQQIEILRRLNESQKDVDITYTEQLRLAEEDLLVARAELVIAEEEFRKLEGKLNELRAKGYEPPSASLTDLESKHAQVAGLWHNNELADARSKLTRLALVLHEAWLAEVSKQGVGFGANLYAISALLSGKLESNPAPIWESLFMVVPVVSTTFASFARQFQDMGPASLGWLFIDEAGQAVPQAAAGALMRARRAVVIGDPLQIEPVFTLPMSLIDALAKLSETTMDGSWSPDRTSVQILADQTNTFGANIATEGDETLWIGSPLRVHRRCADPMFSLANDIAYQGKMVLANSPETVFDNGGLNLGPSAWIDVSGPVDRKQKVPAQNKFLSDLLHAVSTKNKGLPSLYIITPFKEIATDLKNVLGNRDWKDTGVEKSELSKWLNQSVGTVHTFQGKEEDCVIMVLGADAAHEGAARWAASKPNLLNVALTRAKKRFYVVGDRQLWSQMSGFDLVARELPVLTPEAALQRAQDGI